ncbi:unnamed protein product [Polarella glacialis]|uniref:PH domain-containing protein n=1 Tax=Polarella glacialis TaxID=89957 RepID=A0A813GW81_POLGL|nr:unnamed protein product [Polarella glacialis]
MLRGRCPAKKKQSPRSACLCMLASPLVALSVLGFVRPYSQETTSARFATIFELRARFARLKAPQSNGIGGGSSSSTAAGIAGKTGIAGLDRRSVSNSDLEGELEVLVEGPLQQRHLAFFWRWRWCVLDRHQLKLYRDEEASLLMPEKPLEVHSAASLSVGSDLHLPSSLICTSPTGEPLMFLRTGRGERWEEIAAASLWLRAFASANVRSGAMSRRRSSAPPTLPAALGDGTGPQAEGEASSGVIKSEALAGSRKVEAPPRQ